MRHFCGKGSGWGSRGKGRGGRWTQEKDSRTANYKKKGMQREREGKRDAVIKSG